MSAKRGEGLGLFDSAFSVAFREVGYPCGPRVGNSS